MRLTPVNSTSFKAVLPINDTSLAQLNLIHELLNAMYPDSGYVMYPNADIGSPRTGFLVSGKKAINAITTVYIKKGGWAHLNDYEKMKPLEELGTKTAVSGTTVLEAIKNNCFNPETLKILNLAEVRSGLLKVLRMAIQKPPK